MHVAYVRSFEYHQITNSSWDLKISDGRPAVLTPGTSIGPIGATKGTPLLLVLPNLTLKGQEEQPAERAMPSFSGRKRHRILSNYIEMQWNASKTSQNQKFPIPLKDPERLWHCVFCWQWGGLLCLLPDLQFNWGMLWDWMGTWEQTDCMMLKTQVLPCSCAISSSIKQ